MTNGTGRPSLVVDGLSKSYGSTRALSDVSLRLPAGQLVGLVGPNGAGKSTLIKVLAGVVGPDLGSVRFEYPSGERVPIGDKVGVVHQDLGLVDTLTVLENLRLGAVPLYSIRPLLSGRREAEFTSEALLRVGLPPGLGARLVGSLSLGQKTMVAVARILARGARFIIVDEATSALSPRESDWLTAALGDSVAAGCGVLMVSHKLSEILHSADRCVVLVDGRVAADLPRARVDEALLVELMTPRIEDSEARHEQQGEEASAGPAILGLEGACSANAGPFTFEVRSGEVVGITGRIGSGLYDVAYLASGNVRLARGRVVTDRSTVVSFLPPDRATEANFPADPVKWNLSVSALRKWRGRGGLLDLDREQDDIDSMVRALAIRTASTNAPMSSLSGGNQQKVLMGRALLKAPDLLVLAEPTRGVDVATRREIYRLVRKLRVEGKAILIVTSDSEDLLSLADRVGVVENGACSGLWPAAEMSRERLALIL